MKKEKQKKIDTLVNYQTEKYTSRGTLYIIKEKIKNKLKKIENNLKLDFSNFTEYFVQGVTIRKLFVKNIIESNINCPKDKNKWSSTGELKISVKNKEEYFNTENNQSDSEYEIEEIEKMKKKQNVKIHKKPLEMSIWTSDHFPIKLSHFVPLIHILSFISTEFSDLKSALCSNFVPFELFPLKIIFPLGMSFYALLQVTNFNQNLISDSVFELNYDDKKENSINIKLDEDYAKDFYDKYFLEKKNDNHSEFDSSSSFFDERIRDVFLTKRQEDFIDTENYCDISNGAKNESEEINFSNEIKINGVKQNLLDEIISLKKDLLDYEEDIPSEKEQIILDNNKIKIQNKFKFKIPFSPTSRRSNDAIMNYENEHLNKALVKEDSQKTLKCYFKTKCIKNLKNFSKFKHSVISGRIVDKKSVKSLSPVKNRNINEKNCLIF